MPDPTTPPPASITAPVAPRSSGLEVESERARFHNDR